MAELTKNAEIEVQGIKCDAEGCDYYDHDVQANDYGKFINKPCPKCGAPLLTLEDFLSFTALVMAVEAVNTLPPVGTEEDVVTMSVEMNGSGEMRMTVDDEA